ncbi:metalloregulator ArsR/SmtB family transcription factor [Nonomuraea sp. B5E05]|uniref:ArsR/SmtB family transcription factor n=1 Tax=Nonomuraea sp. B5E05 TaxID=3153569 RepID=UPI00326057C8
MRAQKARVARSDLQQELATAKERAVSVLRSTLLARDFIEYRRLTMNGERTPLPRAEAEEYASWFKALADATRIQVVSLLARRRTPMSVGEIVAASGVGQSTISHHLKILAEVRFVLVDKQGTSSLYRINEACVSCFPTAADVVMGKPVPAPPICE